MCVVRLTIHSSLGPDEYYVMRNIFKELLHLPGMSICVLFSILITTAQLLFKELDSKIEHLSPLPGNHSDENQLSLDVEDVMRFYELIRHYVDQVNNNFGLILLVNLIWILTESISTFFEVILGYTYIVLISLQFDFRGMMSDAWLLKLNLDPQLPGYSDFYDFFNSTNYEDLASTYLFELKVYFGVAVCTLRFISFWLRLLIILVPSNSMQVMVNCCYNYTVHAILYNISLFFYRVKGY